MRQNTPWIFTTIPLGKQTHRTQFWHQQEPCQISPLFRPGPKVTVYFMNHFCSIFFDQPTWHDLVPRQVVFALSTSDWLQEIWSAQKSIFPQLTTLMTALLDDFNGWSFTTWVWCQCTSQIVWTKCQVPYQRRVNGERKRDDVLKKPQRSL